MPGDDLASNADRSPEQEMSGGESPEQESEMVAQLQQGDVGAIESLYDRYSRLAYGLAYWTLNDRAGVEDVVQDAFLGLWRNARGVRCWPGQPAGLDPLDRAQPRHRPAARRGPGT